MLASFTDRAKNSVLFRAREFFKRQSARFRRKYIRMRIRRLGLASALGIKTWTSEEELAALFDLATECPHGATVLELGAYLGAATCYIAAGIENKSGTIFCVDTWQNETMPDGVRDTFLEFRSNIASIKAMITTVRKKTSELRDEDIRIPIHFAFIDADHSYDSVKADVEKVIPWMATDGTIALHDTACFPGVSRVLGEVLSAGKWRVCGHIQNLTWITRANW